MDRRGVGTKAPVIVVTGHRLLGEAIGYLLRMRVGVRCEAVVEALAAIESHTLGGLCPVILLLDPDPAKGSEAAVAVAREHPGTTLLRVPAHTRMEELLALVQRIPVRASPPSTCACLSPREREIIALVDAGMSNREIARRLGVSVATVKNHVHHALTKLHARSRWQAAAAMREE